MFVLRDYQIDCVSKMKDSTEGKYGVVLPPGSGKTVIMADYINNVRDLSILIIVHRDELVAQTIDKLKAYGVKAGLEKGTSHSTMDELEYLAEKIENKKRICENKISSMEETLKGIPETRKRLQQSIQKRIESNRMLEEDCAKEIKELGEKLVTKSIEYQQQEERIRKKYARLKLATYGLNKRLNETLDLRKTIATQSKKTNEKTLKELEKFTPELPSVIIASIQSLHEKRLKLWKTDTFDAVFFDEAHHLRAPTWKRVSDYFDANLQFGFSATWIPEDNEFKLLYQKDIMTMMEDGWLVKPEYHKIDVRHKEILPSSESHDDILLQIIQENKNEKIIVFCASVDQACRLQPKLPNSFSLTATTPTQERRSAIRKFKKGSLSILLNYQIVYEGFDDPGATMIVSKITPDPNVYLQASGRGFRPNAWKNTVKIYDIILKEDQSTLPTIFGLHKDWEFEESASFSLPIVTNNKRMH